MTYPFRDCCKEFCPVVHVAFGLVVTTPYALDFTDDYKIAVPRDTLMSSFYLVRSWLQSSFADQTQNLQGLLRFFRTTDKQVSGLTDSERVLPWEQLLKAGLGDTLTHCLAVYVGSLASDSVPAVDDNRSSILAVGYSGSFESCESC